MPRTQVFTSGATRMSQVEVPTTFTSSYGAICAPTAPKWQSNALPETTTDSGLMKLQVQIRSSRYGFWSELWSDIMGANPYHISYRVDWLDAKGMKVNTATSVWLPEILMPGEVKFIQSVAPNANCRDFFISFKEN